jgi:hypothetical protein
MQRARFGAVPSSVGASAWRRQLSTSSPSCPLHHQRIVRKHRTPRGCTPVLAVSWPLLATSSIAHFARENCAVALRMTGPDLGPAVATGQRLVDPGEDPGPMLEDRARRARKQSGFDRRRHGTSMRTSCSHHISPPLREDVRRTRLHAVNDIGIAVPRKLSTNAMIESAVEPRSQLHPSLRCAGCWNR